MRVAHAVVFIAAVVARPQKRVERWATYGTNATVPSPSGLVCEQRTPKATHNLTGVIFVHIFKAAGSSVRQKLRGYAAACGKRWACLIHCTNATKFLVSKTRVHCDVKDEIHMPKVASLALLSTRDNLRRADVLGGHVNVGLGGLWPRPRFVTLMRDPRAAVVSGLRYTHPQSSKAQILNKIRRRARDKAGTARNAVTYLASDSWAVKRNVSAAYADAARNLATFDVVGLVENWDVSMRMLRAFFDPRGVYRDWVSDERDNVSRKKFSTRAVVDALTPDEAAGLDRYLARELDLYRHGVTAHERTCRALLGRVHPCRPFKHGGGS